MLPPKAGEFLTPSRRDGVTVTAPGCAHGGGGVERGVEGGWWRVEGGGWRDRGCEQSASTRRPRRQPTRSISSGLCPSTLQWEVSDKSSAPGKQNPQNPQL